MARNDYESIQQRHDRQAAQKRVVDRFWREFMGTPPMFPDARDALDVIRSALNDNHRDDGNPAMFGFPPVRGEDALDALQSVSAAREEAQMFLQSAERDLIEAARRAGMSWEDIGARYGYRSQPGSHARRRYQTLRKCFPGYTPDPETEAAVTGPTRTPPATA